MDIHIGYLFFYIAASSILVAAGLVGLAWQYIQQRRTEKSFSRFWKLVVRLLILLGASYLILTPFILFSEIFILIKVGLSLIPPIIIGIFYWWSLSTTNEDKKRHLQNGYYIVGIVYYTIAITGFSSLATVLPNHQNSNTSTVFSEAELSEEMMCNDAAFIYCGFKSKQELVDRINSGDGRHNDIETTLGRLGIYLKDVQSSRAVEGYIKTDGTVWVNGNKIAEKVIIGQRQQVQNSTQWTNLFWYRPTSFPLITSARALIYNNNGKFLYGLVNSCGCPVLNESFNVSAPSLNVNLKVKKAGVDSSWQYDVSSKPGEIIDFLITIKNNSDVTVESAGVRNSIPTQMELVTDSYLLRYSTGDAEEPYRDYEPDGAGVEGGQGLGDLWPGQTVYLRFSLKIKDDTVVDYCSDFTLENISYGDYVHDVTTTKNITICQH